MIICRKDMAFAVKHNLGSRLYGGQGQNKLGGAHLCHVGIAMLAYNLLKRHSFCWALHAKWYPSVRIDKESRELNMTSGAGNMEVKVKSK